MTDFVYFIKPIGMDGPIKVGHSTYPISRMAALQTWCPFELEVISEFEAERSVERAIHDRFAKYHIRGEWFQPAAELVALANGIKDGGKLEDLIDLSVKTGERFRKLKGKSPEATIVGTYKQRVERARQYASAVIGQSISLPKDVASILRSAGGYRQTYRSLTDDETSTLDAFIAESRDFDKLLERRRALPPTPVSEDAA